MGFCEAIIMRGGARGEDVRHAGMGERQGETE